MNVSAQGGLIVQKWCQHWLQIIRRIIHAVLGAGLILVALECRCLVNKYTKYVFSTVPFQIGESFILMLAHVLMSADRSVPVCECAKRLRYMTVATEKSGKFI